jgi:hypothetical protein
MRIALIGGNIANRNLLDGSLRNSRHPVTADAFIDDRIVVPVNIIINDSAIVINRF